MTDFQVCPECGGVYKNICNHFKQVCRSKTGSFELSDSAVAHLQYLEPFFQAEKAERLRKLKARYEQRLADEKGDFED